MSINMKDVKSITLGGVSVKKIEDKNGNVLWGKSTQTATIELTVGAGQDITTKQYYNRIVLPSLSTIKSKVASKIGSSSNYINVTKVELDLSTLYWILSISGYSEKKPYFSLSTSNPSYFGSGSTVSSSGGLKTWGSYKLDITSYLKGSTVQLYGYSYEVYYSPHTYEAFKASSGYLPAFTSSSGTGLPKFTIVVTYEH